jgi:hypothetical protein
MIINRISNNKKQISNKLQKAIKQFPEQGQLENFGI